MKAIGKTERELLTRAQNATSKRVVIMHDRANNTRRLAARRLVARGLLMPPTRFVVGPDFKSKRATSIFIYRLTNEGKVA